MQALETFGRVLLLVILCGVPIGVIALLIRSDERRQREEQETMERAHTAYQNALTALKTQPDNADLRQQALALGRQYADLTRNKKGVTVYDEMAVMNDLNAATAGTATTNPVAPAAPVEERLKRLEALHASGVISDQELAARRQAILNEL